MNGVGFTQDGCGEGRDMHLNGMLDFKHSLFFTALPLLCIVLNANQRTKMKEA